jgi:hypothetical protein
MKPKRLTAAALLGVILGGGMTAAVVTTRAQVAPPVPDRLRFRVVTDEAIANADLRSTVPGWRVIVLKDTRTEQCYITFLSTAMMSKTDPGPCP